MARRSLRVTSHPCAARRRSAGRARFVGADAGNAAHFIASDRAEHFRFDLEGFVADRLTRAGVDNIARLATCTYAQDADFFSFRRATHRGEKDYGREISAIVLR